MKVLGLVPARGGSKRVPRKNIADLGGKPLLLWTLEAARDSGVIDEIIVSTEDEEIGLIANKFQHDIWWPRDEKLAQDSTPMLPVVKDVADKTDADIIVTLQPTSPFRTAEDIVKAVNLLRVTKGDSVLSVTAAPSDLAFEVGFARRLRQAPNIVVPNGALYLITKEALDRGETWYSGLAYGYSMPKERSLDIDNGQDLAIARMLVSGECK